MNKRKTILLVVVILVIFLLALVAAYFGWHVRNVAKTSEPNTTETEVKQDDEQSDDQTEVTEEAVMGVDVWDETTETPNETTDETTEPEEETTSPDKENTPTDETTEPTGAGESEYGTEYEWYINLPLQEQQEFYESFESPEAFFAWFNKAKAEYEESQDYIDISGTPGVDLGEIIEGNG